MLDVPLRVKHLPLMSLVTWTFWQCQNLNSTKSDGNAGEYTFTGTDTGGTQSDTRTHSALLKLQLKLTTWDVGTLQTIELSTIQPHLLMVWHGRI